MVNSRNKLGQFQLFLNFTFYRISNAAGGEIQPKGLPEG